MIRDTRMMSRALVQRWNLSPEERRAVIERLLEVVNTSSKPREIISASKGLLAAEAQNQADEHKVVDVATQREHDRLDGIAADLGIDASLIEAAEREASGSLGGAKASADTDDSN